MGKNDFMGKLKEGVSVQEVEEFARKYTTEVFTVLAVVIGAISSMFDFFTGPSLTILFIAVGIVLGVFFPVPVERGVKQLYTFTYKQEKTTQLILGAVQIIVAIFIPFLLFGIIGLLAGTAHHYYTRQSQSMKDVKMPHQRHGNSGEEHD
jgi:fatty acid desaturase